MACCKIQESKKKARCSINCLKSHSMFWHRSKRNFTISRWDVDINLVPNRITRNIRSSDKLISEDDRAKAVHPVARHYGLVMF